METRAPSSPRSRSVAHDRGRAWIAVAASALIHGVLALGVTVSGLALRDPPRVDVEEPIVVELVDVAIIEPRASRSATGLPIEIVQAAKSEVVVTPAQIERHDLAQLAAASGLQALPAEAPGAPLAPPDGPAVAAPAEPARAVLPAGPNVAEAPAGPSTAALEIAAAPTSVPAASVPPAETDPSGPEPAIVSTAGAAPAAVPVPPPSSDLAQAMRRVVLLAPAASVADSAPVAARSPDPIAAAPAEAGIQEHGGEPLNLAAVSPPPAMAAIDPRDAVDTILKSMGCARVGATFDAVAGTLVLRGHVPNAESRDRLVAELAAQSGVGHVDPSGVGVMGQPYCQLLAFLNRPDFARSTEQRGDLSELGAANPPGRRRLRGGEGLDLRITAPDFDSFLYVDHFSTDGRVTHLLPTNRQDNAFKADEAFGLGPGGRGWRAIATPPYGLDVVTVLAASEPLLSPGRPVQENAADYLAALDSAVRRLAATGRPARYEYAYYLVTTEPPPENRADPAPARSGRKPPGG